MEGRRQAGCRIFSGRGICCGRLWWVLDHSGEFLGNFAHLGGVLVGGTSAWVAGVGESFLLTATVDVVSVGVGGRVCSIVSLGTVLVFGPL